MNLEPRSIPKQCPARNYNSLFTVEHADICGTGATTIRRHNHIRDILGSYAKKAFGTCSTTLEPSLGSLDEKSKSMVSGNSGDQARADICIRSLSTPQIDAFLDIAVIPPTCEKNVGSKVASILRAKEKSKRSMYEDRIRKQAAGEFDPVVFSTGGATGDAAKKVIRAIADKLSCKTDEDSKLNEIS